MKNFIEDAKEFFSKLLDDMTPFQKLLLGLGVLATTVELANKPNNNNQSDNHQNNSDTSEETAYDTDDEN